MKRLLGLVLALVLAVGLPAGAAGERRGRGPRAITTAQACTDSVDQSIAFSLPVEGESATGRYSLPAEKPVGLVLFAHGYGHTSKSWDVHLRNASRDLGVIAVAMDYRGTKIMTDAEVPSSRGWRVAEGAVDSIVAAQYFDQACPGMGTFVDFGVSMGGNTSGLIAAAGAKRPTTGAPLFDYWIDVEGATNVIETYHEATAAAAASSTAANAKADIEEEMGGTFLEQPDVYRERTVVLRADDIAASGIKGVVLVHGLDDGLVPYNQSREMAAALAAEGVAYDFYTISRRDSESEQDTTITGTVIGPIKGDYVSPLAGHASEKSTTNIVMKQSLAALKGIYDGTAAPTPGCRGEYHVDGGGQLSGGGRRCGF